MQLDSEKVTLSSPMSFNGSFTRLKKHMPDIWAAILCLVLIWPIILIWYIIAYGLFSVFTLPYRLIRRSNRKNKRSALQHRETLDAIKNR